MRDTLPDLTNNSICLFHVHIANIHWVFMVVYLIRNKKTQIYSLPPRNYVTLRIRTILPDIYDLTFSSTKIPSFLKQQPLTNDCVHDFWHISITYPRPQTHLPSSIGRNGRHYTTKEQEKQPYLHPAAYCRMPIPHLITIKQPSYLL